MSNRDVVVRIVKPSEQPQLPREKSVPASPKKEKKNIFQIILNGALILLMGVVGIFIAVNFFKIGISWKDIVLILSVPLVIGVITSYVIS